MIKIISRVSGRQSRLFPSCGSKRGCSSKNEINSLINTPLSVKPYHLPKPIFASSGKLNHETQVTTLSNGLRVASEPYFGQYCTVGVAIDSGSRYEVAHHSGISHFLEKLAFNSTKEYEGSNDILQALESHGGICDCQSSRDVFVYASSIETAGLDVVIKVLSEAVLKPQLKESEIADARQAVMFEIEDVSLKPDQDTIVMEMIHSAAFKDNTLGLPKLCPPENIESINQKVLYSYLSTYHDPSRMVLAGVGVSHDELVAAAQKYFVAQEPAWGMQKQAQIDDSTAQYTGGDCLLEKDLSNLTFGPSPLPELAHFVLGFESCSHQDEDFVPYCVLNTIMGGGGSFSAGGPGKGMYTRLYTNVLNRHHWMYSATAYNHAYSDSGIFCIHGSSPPSHLRDMVEVITREFINMTKSLHPSELQRAKQQLQSMLLMNLESRPVVFEDISRQVLANNKRYQPDYFINKIVKVTAEDIIRVAERLLQSKASICALGNLDQFPEVNDIKNALYHQSYLPKKKTFSLFR